MDSGARAESGCGRDGRLCAAVLVNGSAATVLSTWLRPGVDVLRPLHQNPATSLRLLQQATWGCPGARGGGGW
jgi:hypothetical protein